ncbi:DUF4232 domain-containing protein [Actinacidiphila bryophytorum]|nr:DUF4232 domain-containing protein [Actinacidiphila bryophytorum]
MKSTLPSAAVLLVGALALTACQSDSTGAASAPSSPSASTSAVAPSVSPSKSGSQSAPAATSASATTPPATGAGTTKAAPKPAPAKDPGAASDPDGYAFRHPCGIGQLSVQVTRRAGAPTQRVIAVRNTGPLSCGLSYYPLVVLDSAKAQDGTAAVHPLVPDGLGGPPAYPVYAGHTAYAVVDLDPSGATTGTATGVDEMDVLPDAGHMPAAQTLDFPLGKGTSVLKPKLGLYRDTVADAVASMRTADMLP